MSRDEIQKLLGGYATGTLTGEEQQALFAAALEDQELFDTLAREQSLRDLLSDSAARASLLAALDAPAPEPWLHRWWKPLSAAGVAVVLATVAIIATVAVRRHTPAAPPVTVAKLEPPVASPVAAPPPPAAAEPSPVRANPIVARQKKSPPVNMQPMAPAPAPPPAAPPAPKGKVEGVLSAGAQMVQAQAGAPTVTPAISLDKAGQLQNLPVSTRKAMTTGVIADLKTGAASPDARALFYGTGFASTFGAVGGGGRGGAAGGTGSRAASGFRPLAEADTASPAGHLGIQYRVLRKTPAGEFVEADSAATGLVAAGTIFKLQITANDSGYVRILQEAPDGAWREMLTHSVERMQPIETEPIELDQPGRVRFYLSFSRQPLPPSNVAQPDDDIMVDRGRVVTIAARAAAARQLSFNITLTVQ